MPTFHIESKAGLVYGEYEAETARDAWLAMLVDAGSGPDDEAAGTMDDWIIREAPNA